MAMARGIGATVLAPGADSPAVWFGEDQGRYLLAVPADQAEAIGAQARKARVPFAIIGETGGELLRLGAAAPLVVQDLLEAHEGWMPAYMAGEVASA
jgi:phosphoribosylformylglycinamidine synthase